MIYPTQMTPVSQKSVAIIVAHPDDETLWVGGTILRHLSWKFFIVCMSRQYDIERATKFYKALKILSADGIMGDLDDGPQQAPLEENKVQQLVLELLPPVHYDLVITHNPSGEYTRHIRHEDVSKAVINLWKTGKISASELRTFAYEDNKRAYYPRPERNAPVYQILTKSTWLRKYSLITKTYGFEKTSWEAQTTPRAEAFWQFTDPGEAVKWIEQEGVKT